MAPENDSLNFPPPPPAVAAGSGRQMFYVVRHPWQWVMKRDSVGGDMIEVESPSLLPSAIQQAKLETLNGTTNAPGAMTPKSARQRRLKIRDRLVIPAMLRVEIVNTKTQAVEFAVHGTSAAFDGLEDKDELVRTIKRCRCDELDLSPPSILLNWDVTKEECVNVVGKNLPKLQSNKSKDVYVVLKEPMGSQGHGIYFVRTVEEIHKIIDDNRQRALKEPDLLDNLIAVKNRIPSWVLQAEVVPPMLTSERRKFHIRTYLVCIERPDLDDLVRLFIYNRHEVRIAGAPVETQEEADRDPLAHITNGALSSTTTRVLMSSVPELKGMQEKVETFVATTFGKHLLPDITRRVSASMNQTPSSNVSQFAIAGLDLMVTSDNRIYLLEANNNPAAPPRAMVDDEFYDHLTGFMRDLIDLVVGTSSSNFLSADEILRQKGLL